MNQEATKKNILVPFLIVMALMFFWNMTRNVNDVLIPHLKRACQLSDFESSLIQSAFFGAYFLIAIPAGLFIQRRGYKAGMLMGLFLAALGAFLFYPAAHVLYYPLFLLALFVMASGFTFLEVTATPYISKLGDYETASSRLSLAAAVGSVGATLAPYISSLLLLHEKDISEDLIAAMTPDTLTSFLKNEADLVKLPYLILAATFLLAGLIVYAIALPAVKEEKTVFYSFKNIFKFSHAVYGIFGVFAYVGAEVGIVSFMIRFSKSLYLPELTEQKAALFISIFMAFVLIGRLLGTFILKRFRPNHILFISSVATILLLLLAIIENNYLSLWCLSFIGIFTSVVYPILFTLSINDLGEYTKTASSLLIMGIVGGAIVPPIMGKLSDLYSIRISYIMPVLCYVYILFYALKGHIIKVSSPGN